MRLDEVLPGTMSLRQAPEIFPSPKKNQRPVPLHDMWTPRQLSNNKGSPLWCAVGWGRVQWHIFSPRRTRDSTDLFATCMTATDWVDVMQLLLLLHWVAVKQQLLLQLLVMMSTVAATAMRRRFPSTSTTPSRCMCHARWLRSHRQPGCCTRHQDDNDDESRTKRERRIPSSTESTHRLANGACMQHRDL